MRIVCVSDTHREHHMLDVPEGDVLIHAGDFTDWGSLYDVVDISEWFNAQSHPCKILIAGNHDWGFEKDYKKYKKMCDDLGIIYLQDSSVEIEGIKIQKGKILEWEKRIYRF